MFSPILNGIRQMISIYEKETTNKPQEITISRDNFGSLLGELNNKYLCIYSNDPWCGIMIDDVLIGWSIE